MGRGRASARGVLTVYFACLVWLELTRPMARGEGYEEERVTSYRRDVQPHLSVSPMQKNFEMLRSTFLGGDKYPFPLLVTAFDEKSYKDGQNLVASMTLSNPQMPILIYDLGLRKAIKDTITKTWCNTLVLPMPKVWDSIPSTDRRKTDLGLGAWKPLIISDVLENITSTYIIYSDAQGMVLNNIQAHDRLLGPEVNTSLVLARPDGKHLIGAYTHNTTLKHLHQSPKDRDLVKSPQVCSAQLVVANNWETRNLVLDPWIKCAMELDCIAPQGAIWEDGLGCNLDTQYYGNYTCELHTGGQAVLSVILHKLFFKLHKRMDWNHGVGQKVYHVNKHGQPSLSFKFLPPYFSTKLPVYVMDGVNTLYNTRHGLLCPTSKEGKNRFGAHCPLSMALPKGSKLLVEDRPDHVIQQKCGEMKRSIQGWKAGQFVPIRGDQQYPNVVINSDDPP